MSRPQGQLHNWWLLLRSRFSHVRLCATPQMAAHQAPPSLGFSRQEHWSGLPFPSPMHACMLSRFSRVRLCAILWTAAHQAPPSTGFSRQEHWGGLPFPHDWWSPVYKKKKWARAESVDGSLLPRGSLPQALWCRRGPGLCIPRAAGCPSCVSKCPGLWPPSPTFGVPVPLLLPFPLGPLPRCPWRPPPHREPFSTGPPGTAFSRR